MEQDSYRPFIVAILRISHGQFDLLISSVYREA